jgi:predicted ATPase
MADLLIGREPDRARLRDALTSHRLVTLTGPPGVGKSALARAHARPRTAVVVDLSSVSDAALLPMLVADAIGLDPGDSPDRWLIPQSAPDLLVLDGADAIGAASLPRLNEWLDANDALRILVTSRSRLGGPREVCVELAPLRVEDGAELLRVRAEAVRANWGAGADDCLRSVSERLDGLPLALELAAGRAALLSPPDLLARLDAPLELLGGAVGAPSGLRGSLERSMSALTPSALRLLGWLSTFGGSFDLPAAERLAEGAGGTLDDLQELMDRCLLARSPSEGSARFHMLGVVRERAAELLEEAGDADDAEGAHGVWLAERSWTLARGLGGPSGSESLEALQGLRAQLVRALKAGALPGDVLVSLALSLDRLHRHRGGLTDHAPLLDAVLAKADDPRLRAARQRLRRLGEGPAEAMSGLVGDHFEVRVERGAALLDLGRNRRALGELDAAEKALPSDHPEPDLRVRLAILRARATARRGRADDAERVLDHVLGSGEQGIGPMARARCLQEFARIELLRGRRHEARLALSEAQSLLEGEAETRLGAALLVLQSEVERDDGPLVEAIELYRASGDRRGEAFVLERRVGLLVAQGSLQEARDTLTLSLRLARTLNEVPTQVRLLELAALLDWQLHGAAEARKPVEEAVRLAQNSADTSSLALIEALQAAVFATLGDRPAATEGFARSEDLLGATTHAAPPPDAFLHRAHLDLAEGRPESASDRLVDAWQLARSLSRNHKTAAGVLRRRAPFQLALRLVSSGLPDPLRRTTWERALDEGGTALLLEPDGSWFRPPGGSWVDRSRHVNQRRLLAHLAGRHGEGPVAAEQIQEALWPGERILPDAAQNRIHKVVSLLRKAGLGPLIQRETDGYRLDPDREVLLLPDRAPPRS